MTNSNSGWSAGGIVPIDKRQPASAKPLQKPMVENPVWGRAKLSHSNTMPRPRVPPDQRHRVAQACGICREAKKRCSGTAPCSYCVRRGLVQRCVISKRGGGRQGAGRQRGRESGDNSAGDNKSTQGDDVSMNTILVSNVVESGREQSSFNQDGQYSVEQADEEGEESSSAQLNVLPRMSDWVQRETTPGQRQRQNDTSEREYGFGTQSAGNVEGQGLDSSTEATSSTSARFHSRMLLNSRGEQVYIGGAASISFLQLVRTIVADHLGPTQFSHSDSSRIMLEKEPRRTSRNTSISSISSSIELDADTRLQYYECYRIVTNGFIDIFTTQEASEFLNPSPATISSSLQKQATFKMIIAIGAQCSSVASAQDVGPLWFRKAQAEAHVDMLEEPDVDVVRSFLLMAFYLLGDCRRNAAFMYLGIARQSAVALGMHSPDMYRDLDDEATIWRLRIWTSLLTVDMLVNSILGRPSPMPGLNSDIEPILQNLASKNMSPDAVSRLIASHQIVSIISDIADTLSRQKPAATSVVVSLLDRVEAWSQRRPDCLQTPSQDGTGLSNSSSVVGSVHVSCLYYFAVILVTRPVFISSIALPLTSSMDHPQSQLASACLDASVYLVQTCIDAKKMDLLYGNMCILKALVFAAGLVLGVEMFTRRSTEPDIETAFAGARQILHFMAAQSPQAGHYFEILTLLSNAVEKQRQNLATTGGRSKYVSRVFTLQGSSKDTCTREEFTPLATPVTEPALAEEVFRYPWPSLSRGSPAAAGEEMFLEWDDLDLSLWDSFPQIA